MVHDTRPVIGIPARSVVDSSNGFRYSGIPLTYSNAIERAGGAPILIPLHLSEETLSAIYYVAAAKSASRNAARRKRRRKRRSA